MVAATLLGPPYTDVSMTLTFLSHVKLWDTSVMHAVDRHDPCQADSPSTDQRRIVLLLYRVLYKNLDV